MVVGKCVQLPSWLVDAEERLEQGRRLEWAAGASVMRRGISLFRANIFLRWFIKFSEWFVLENHLHIRGCDTNPAINIEINFDIKN